MTVDPSLPGRELDATIAVVRQLVIDECRLDPTEVRDDSDLFDDLGLESLDLLSVVADAEQRFDITVLDEDLGHVRTIRELGDVVLTRGGHP